MDWVNEREEWLLDWSDARCLREISFETTPGAGALQFLEQDPLDVFFSDIIETQGRCFVCRANGSLVDIFDISPRAESFVSWRVHLPSSVVHDIGFSHVCSVNDASVSILFLTKAHTIHRVQILLNSQVPDVIVAGSTTCNLSSPPSSFCALDSDFAAIGCFNGALFAVRLSNQDHASGGPVSAYELTDASLVRRIISGFVHPTLPVVSAIAAVGPGQTAIAASGFLLISFSADGQLRLWEALEHRGHLVASRTVPTPAVSPQDQRSPFVGTSSTYMRVSPSKTRACLVLRSTVYVIDLQALGTSDALAVSVVEPPFASATPSLVTLSHSTLWSFWSGREREQLFHFELEDHGTPVWQSRALDANFVDAEAAVSKPGLCSVVTEGSPFPSMLSHRAVFTLYQQHEAWRTEEDGFDAFHVAGTLHSQRRRSQDGQPADAMDTSTSYFENSVDEDMDIEDLVLQWWVDRILCPGRYPGLVLAAALREAGGRMPQDADGRSNASSLEAIRKAIENHLRRRATLCGSRNRDSSATVNSQLQVITNLADAAGDFLRICDAVWKKRHQVCGLVSSSAWAPHAWSSAGSVSANTPEHVTATCPVLLCHGGASCIRAVHSWSERWWTTFQFTLDASKYNKIEIDDVLALSVLDEWKLCATAWFLSQCVGSSKLSVSLSLLRHGFAPSTSLSRFVRDVPEHLASHVARCASCMKTPAVASVLDTLKEAVLSTSRPGESLVDAASRPLDTLRGTWPDQKAFANVHTSGSEQLCLSDMLRGSIAVSECGHLCAAMRDLLLLCVYAARDEADGCTWTGLTQVLDQELPLHTSLHQSMKLELPSPSSSSGVSKAMLPAATRGCDLWAATYRNIIDGRRLGLPMPVALRVPVASFRGLRYAMKLLHFECWGSLHCWSRHQSMEEFVAYLAGCERVATLRIDAAREAFEHAEKIAPILIEFLHSAGLDTKLSGAGPHAVAYYEHVAAIFGTRGHLKEELLFLRKAADLAEEARKYATDDDQTQLQRLWSHIFEKAVNLDMWEEAYDVLLRIDSFENHLRLLAQKLRKSGRIELMLKLPEKHRAFFMKNLQEHAILSPPTVGSDSLACYQHLYALHFMGNEYLKAAHIAHSLYSALHNLLKHSTPDIGHSIDGFMQMRAGDCISNPADVPFESVSVPMELEVSHVASEPNPHAKARDHAGPLLEEQKNALVMLITALSMTPEKMLLIMPNQGGNSLNAGFANFSGEAHANTATIDPRNPANFREWFAEAQGAATETGTFRLSDAEALLVTTEAQMVLCGRSDARSPSEVAQRVAGLGLLGLALQITHANDLDPWHFALQPFVQLCIESERSPAKVAAMVDTAQGPAQAYMLGHANGHEFLGAGGCLHSGWWNALEQGLWTVHGNSGGSGPRATAPTDGVIAPIGADATRLYSLVAEEVLSAQPAVALPNFVTRTLSAGPSWVCLLRLYMKHRHLGEAVQLLGQQLRRCCLSQMPKVAAEPHSWSPLQGFPVSLVVQLRTYVGQEAKRQKGGMCTEYAEELDAILAGFQRLLEESEKCLDR